MISAAIRAKLDELEVVRLEATWMSGFAVRQDRKSPIGFHRNA